MILRGEEGAALVVTLMMLAALTIIGIAATKTSEVEVLVSNNERLYQRDFYAADSGWRTGAMWLDEMASPPARVNSELSDDTVRNFGDGGQDVINDAFPDGTEDATVGGIPFWYRVTYLGNTVVPGSGQDYRNFSHDVISIGNRSQQIQVRLFKVYRVGY